MSNICDADLQYLKPGKRVVLKSFKGSLAVPQDVKPEENYWKLIGSKAVVEQTNNTDSVLIKFERDFSDLGLATANALWILISDLKFICRY
ncbi:hypothetical protein GCM10011613_04100 [Cellvibrio zantedeschiae]|uniref:Uncharacterized protein n=1 Tax=Cellvibrio zantedeschiae TaxID=1237077 RepID=A0ABQ3AS05_9GAMM|nr:hypothetical protein [Cellvibrio zantedeschiae]GGY63569.1 hypothetical protein GCM10011613_04100 [Cellvibrio zantedeschiae]